MDHTELLRKIALSRKAKTYLEIGVAAGHNFARMHDCGFDAIVGVDPEPSVKCTFKMTSDEFFKRKLVNFTFDLVFIDGLHISEQVYKDIQNALACLSKSGVIVCHDMKPSDESHQKRRFDFKEGTGTWTGDCWKAFAKYASESPYRCFTADFDWGCGVIDTSKPCRLDKPTVSKTIEEMTWQDFVDHSKDWLDFKSEKETLELLSMNDSTVAIEPAAKQMHSIMSK